MPERAACQAGGALTAGGLCVSVCGLCGHGGRASSPVSSRPLQKRAGTPVLHDHYWSAPTWTVAISRTVVKLLRMFARRIRVEYEQNGRRVPCPMKWLDSFSMRNFTNSSVFDNTLPVADGVMEIGTHVPVQELKAAMEDWFRRKSYLPKGVGLILGEAS
jgi:hypothetical protein